MPSLFPTRRIHSGTPIRPLSARLVCRDRSILSGDGGPVRGGPCHGWKLVRVSAVRPQASLAE